MLIEIFGAPSLDLTRDPGSNNARLTLFDRDGNPTEYLPFSDMLSAGGTLGARREEADWNKPMHWTMYQRRLFRPTNDPAFDSSLPMGDPSTEDYWAYQYADADGDGILDSRWFELVDYTNPTRPVSPTAQDHRAGDGRAGPDHPAAHGPPGAAARSPARAP